MKPKSSTLKNDRRVYHYDFSFLREFITLGRKEGNVGLILVEQNSRYNVYRGFGTIENPNRTLMTINLKPLKIFEDNQSNKGFPYKSMWMFFP